MDKRLSYIDLAKGLAIILMVFAHAFPGKGAINTWIFSFHMPIFFIICGILQQRRGKPDWRKTLSKRVFQLGIPYLV